MKNKVLNSYQSRDKFIMNFIINVISNYIIRLIMIIQQLFNAQIKRSLYSNQDIICFKPVIPIVTTVKSDRKNTILSFIKLLRTNSLPFLRNNFHKKTLIENYFLKFLRKYNKKLSAFLTEQLPRQRTYQKLFPQICN